MSLLHPFKKKAEVTPESPGTSLMGSQTSTWTQRDLDSIFDEFRESFLISLLAMSPHS
jgi:hypothetical protein